MIRSYEATEGICPICIGSLARVTWTRISCEIVAWLMFCFKSFCPTNFLSGFRHSDTRDSEAIGTLVVIVTSWLLLFSSSLVVYCLLGLVVKASVSRSGIDSRLRLADFSRLSQTSDFKLGTPAATLPGVWCYRVSAGTGWPVSVYCDWVRQKV